jgi:hypothetical protein
MASEAHLSFGDCIAIAGIVGGFAGTLAAMALPLAYPALPPWVWRTIFWPSVLLLVGTIIFLILDLILRRSLGPTAARRMRVTIWGPWILIVGGPLLGVAWLYLNSVPIPDRGPSPLARLAELGWSIKSGPDSIQFGVSTGSLPPMVESSKYFKLLNRPFNLALQQVKALDGLHFLSDVPGCLKIEISAGEFTDISELSGFVNLTNLVIGQLPLNGTATVDLTPLSSLTRLETLVLTMVRARSIEPLVSLTRLKVLNLGQTLISDISAVSEMRLLESLEIRGTRVSDLRPLSDISGRDYGIA